MELRLLGWFFGSLLEDVSLITAIEHGVKGRLTVALGAVAEGLRGRMSGHSRVVRTGKRQACGFAGVACAVNVSLSTPAVCIGKISHLKCSALVYVYNRSKLVVRILDGLSPRSDT